MEGAQAGTRALSELAKQRWGPGKPKKLELTGQSSRGETAAQRENAEDLQRVPPEYTFE